MRDWDESDEIRIKGADSSTFESGRVIEAEDTNEMDRSAKVSDARAAVDAALAESAPLPDFAGNLSDNGLPITADVVTSHTDGNRVALADDIPGVPLIPRYDGYFDVVIHADAEQTQGDVAGQRVDFTLSETARLITDSPGWDGRPIRLMACQAGQEAYAQNLADMIGAVVYAPSEALSVWSDGRTVVEDAGTWRRFEPRTW